MAGRPQAEASGRGGDTNLEKEEEYDLWRQCIKCHQSLVEPKALPCLHTVCLHCLRIHYQTVKSQVSVQTEQKPEQYHFFAWDGCFPCPVCHYPCYTLNGRLDLLPSNTRLLRLSYRERLNFLQKSNKDFMLFSPLPHEAGQVPDEVIAHTGGAETAEGFSRNPSDKNDVCSGFHEPSNHHLRENKKSSRMKDAHKDELRITNGETESPSPSCLSDNLRKVGDASKNRRLMGLQLHWDHVVSECGQKDGLLFKDEDQPTPGHQPAHKLHQYDLRHGEDVLELLHPNAIAVNTHTGHVVVVDTTWNKAVLYKTHRKPFSYKSFHHPIIDVCFYPPSKTDREEKFCAMGRRADKKGIMVYTAVFNKDPKSFKCMYQKNIRDVSGLLVIEPDILFVSLCYANTVIRQLNESQFVDLATHTQHGLYYPTHMTYTTVGEVIVADTGNHRIGVFYGPEYLAYDFYGQFGSEYGNFFYPMGVAADESRHLYVCDTNNYRVQVFDRYYRFQSCLIQKTYVMGRSVAQDVKPIDCAVNNKQKIVVLFRGRGFMSLQVFRYTEPQILLRVDHEASISSSSPPQTFCWLCCLGCFSRCHNGSDARPSQTEYERIQ